MKRSAIIYVYVHVRVCMDQCQYLFNTLLYHTINMRHYYYYYYYIFITITVICRNSVAKR